MPRTLTFKNKLCIAGAVIAFDLLTKLFAVLLLTEGATYRILGHWLEFILTDNQTGMNAQLMNYPNHVHYLNESFWAAIVAILLTVVLWTKIATRRSTLQKILLMCTIAVVPLIVSSFLPQVVPNAILLYTAKLHGVILFAWAFVMFTDFWVALGFALILGAGVGNWINMLLMRGGVIDFLWVPSLKHVYGIANFADYFYNLGVIFVICRIGMLLIKRLFRRQRLDGIPAKNC